jgi:hypothetical protein
LSSLLISPSPTFAAPTTNTSRPIKAFLLAKFQPKKPKFKNNFIFKKKTKKKKVNLKGF